MPKLGTELGAVQTPLIEYAQAVGWEYLAPDDCLRMRKGEEGFILESVFVDQMQRLNPDFMDNLLAEELIRRLNLIRPNIEGNREIWEHLRGVRTVYVPNLKLDRNVSFMDKENLSRNSLQVTDEFVFKRGRAGIRPDVVFLVNYLI